MPLGTILRAGPCFVPEEVLVTPIAHEEKIFMQYGRINKPPLGRCCPSTAQNGVNPVNRNGYRSALEWEAPTGFSAVCMFVFVFERAKRLFGAQRPG